MNKWLILTNKKRSWISFLLFLYEFFLHNVGSTLKYNYNVAGGHSEQRSWGAGEGGGISLFMNICFPFSFDCIISDLSDMTPISRLIWKLEYKTSRLVYMYYFLSSILSCNANARDKERFMASGRNGVSQKTICVKDMKEQNLAEICAREKHSINQRITTQVWTCLCHIVGPCTHRYANDCKYVQKKGVLNYVTRD